jgi:hypothetical protein
MLKINQRFGKHRSCHLQGDNEQAIPAGLGSPYHQRAVRISWAVQ